MAIDIIGGGIGGLTLAIALHQKGMKFRVFEQAPSLDAVGAGIILANNAMQVYEKLGLRPQIEALGHPIAAMNIRDRDLKGISEMQLDQFERRFGVRNIAIHRGVLQQLLLSKIPQEFIYLGKQLVDIQQDNGIELAFMDGSQHYSQAVVAVDGIYSTVRRCLFQENTIRKANQICWRGIMEFKLPDPFHRELNECWGLGDRFGFVQISKDKVYWYALQTILKHHEVSKRHKPDLYFENYHPLVQTILEHTPVEAIHTDGIFDLKPIHSWTTGCVCLLGDAAHATTPNLGQGACQAIEGAYVLAECLQKFPISKAFKNYEKTRIKKAHLVVNASWKIGKMAHVTNPFLAKARNLLMRTIPSRMNVQLTHQIFELSKISNV